MSCMTNWFLHQDQCRWEVRESVDQVQNNWYPCWTLSYSHLWLYRDWPCLSLVTYIINRYFVHCSVNFTLWTKYTTIGIHDELCPINSFDQLHLYFTKKGIFRCIHNRLVHKNLFYNGEYMGRSCLCQVVAITFDWSALATWNKHFWTAFW